VYKHKHIQVYVKLSVIIIRLITSKCCAFPVKLTVAKPVKNILLLRNPKSSLYCSQKSWTSWIHYKFCLQSPF